MLNTSAAEGFPVEKKEKETSEVSQIYLSNDVVILPYITQKGQELLKKYLTHCNTKIGKFHLKIKIYGENSMR